MKDAGEPSGRCLLCGSRDDPIVFEETVAVARSCDACALIYADPRIPDDIDHTIDPHSRDYYALPARLRARFTARYCPPGSLLEVGCGEGYYLAAAREAGYEIAGMEPHPRRAEHAGTMLGIPIDRRHIEEVAAEPRFDVVFHIDLLAHFPDPERGLRAMTGLLRPGGVLCFEVGLVAGRARGWYRRMPDMALDRHRVLFSERSLATLLRRTGLEIVRQRRYGLGIDLLLTRLYDRLLRRGGPGRPLAPERFDDQRRGGLLRYLKNYALRYRLGALTPAFGPGTALVVARPIRAST